MPPKERKSVSQWMLCESCGSTVSNKDVMCHSEMNCPPASGNFVHGYIKEKVIYSRIEELKHDASKFLFKYYMLSSKVHILQKHYLE
jgi:hypothetical protein